MGVLLIGIYLIAVGYQGQAGNLITLLSQEGPFIPWAISVGILAWIWRVVPPPGKEPVHMVIGAAVLGVILLEASKIIAGLESAWSGLSNFSGSGSSNNVFTNLVGSTGLSQPPPMSGTADSPDTTSSGSGSAGTSSSGSGVTGGAPNDGTAPDANTYYAPVVGGSGPKYTYSQLVQLAQNAGFTGLSAYTIAAISLAESSGYPNNLNPADPQGSYGLLQINAKAWPGSQQTALTPQQAFDYAYQNISKQGTYFSPWSTYKNGAYLKYLQG